MALRKCEMCGQKPATSAKKVKDRLDDLCRDCGKTLLRQGVCPMCRERLDSENCCTVKVSDPATTAEGEAVPALV